jgi:type II secretory pathway pseudopilin PulG
VRSVNSDQAGFSAIELVFVIVLISALSIAAIWSHHTTKSTAKTTSAAAQYLQIKELEIRLPLTSGIKDLVYAYNPTTNSLYFSTTSIDDQDPSCTPSATNTGAFGVVSVSSTAITTTVPAGSSTSVNPDGTLYAIANGYYLYLKGSSNDCLYVSSPPAAAQALYTKQLPLFQSALKAASGD